MTDPRIRIAAKQTAKNYWQIDATVENETDFFTKLLNKNDVGDTEEVHIANKLLNIVKKTEEAFRADGRKMVGDDERPQPDMVSDIETILPARTPPKPKGKLVVY